MAQEQNIHNDSLYSSILKEQRQIQVIFPKKYKPDQKDKLDVIYVLDGEWNTSLTQKLYDFMEYAKFIPVNAAMTKSKTLLPMALYYPAAQIL